MWLRNNGWLFVSLLSHDSITFNVESMRTSIALEFSHIYVARIGMTKFCLTVWMVGETEST